MRADHHKNSERLEREMLFSFQNLQAIEALAILNKICKCFFARYVHHDRFSATMQCEVVHCMGGVRGEQPLFTVQTSCKA